MQTFSSQFDFLLHSMHVKVLICNVTSYSTSKKTQ